MTDSRDFDGQTFRPVEDETRTADAGRDFDEKVEAVRTLAVQVAVADALLPKSGSELAVDGGRFQGLVRALAVFTGGDGSEIFRELLERAQTEAEEKKAKIDAVQNDPEVERLLEQLNARVDAAKVDEGIETLDEPVWDDGGASAIGLFM